MVRVAILTASDQGAEGHRADSSGDLVEERCRLAGHEIAARALCPDDRAHIADRLRRWSDSGAADVIITTGGTGLAARDVTPEATRDVAERDVPGIPIALAFEGLKKTPYAILSRGIAVLRGRTLIVNLPGHPRAVGEGLDVLLPLLPHIGQLLAGPLEHRTPADTGHTPEAPARDAPESPDTEHSALSPQHSSVEQAPLGTRNWELGTGRAPSTPPMRVDVLTLFPAAFAGPLDVSIIRRARDAGLLDLHLHDIREHATDRHRSVDDYPFGGGHGMVMRVDVLDAAVEHVQALASERGTVIYLSPQGERLDDAISRELARLPRLVLVCGRYEGVDERFVEHCVDRQISIGDYVLTGGELPAMVLVDAVTRHVPGALGDAQSHEDESFAGGLLEHAQYTRPAEYRGWTVPDVLLSGHHRNIERWKAEQREVRTRERRPDLLHSPEGAPADHNHPAGP